MCVYMYRYMCIYVYKYMCIYVYMRMCVCVYIYEEDREGSRGRERERERLIYMACCVLAVGFCKDSTSSWSS